MFGQLRKGSSGLERKLGIFVFLIVLFMFSLFVGEETKSVSIQKDSFAPFNGSGLAHAHIEPSTESVPVATKPIPDTVYRVTLVTGDIVIATDLSEEQKSVSIIPADPTKMGQGFQAFETPKGTYVIPSDVNLDKLDIELFNIDYLISEGYHNMANLPVIVSTAGISDQVTQPIEKGLWNSKGSVRSSFPRLSALAVQLPLHTIKDSIQILLNRADVEKIWLDRRVHVSLSESVPLIGTSELWVTGYNGTGIEIAILDTGIDETHPDLDDLDDDSNTVDPKVIRAVDFTDDLTTDDLYGHGTHCAGIAAGTGAASGGIIKGVAPGAWLWNVKVLNQYGWGQWSWVISGIEYAAYGPDGIANTGDEADIISMSLGGAPTDGTDPVSLAVDAAVDAGVVVVIAAGNDWDYFRIDSPGVARKVITVGASDKYDKIAYFSSKGPTIDFRVKPDVLAPGLGINSSVPNNLFGTYYQSKSGTSMATPHVAGAAALMLHKGVPSGWSAPQYVKDVFISTAVDLGYDVYTQGGGRIYVPSAAYTQILVDPATVSFGFYLKDTLDNATLTFYNLNETSSRALTLSVTVYDTFTGTPVDCASFNTTIVNIDPSSYAPVLLTINTTVPKSVYSGKVIANIDTGETIHVIFGFTILNELTVTKVDMTGAPAAYDYVHIIGDPGFPEWTSVWLDEYGNTTFYVTDGTYHIISTGQDYDIDSTIYTIAENVSITTDTLIYLDERNTVPIDFNTNKPDQIIAEKTASLFYEGEQRSIWFMDIRQYPTSALAYVSPTSIDTGFTYGYYPEAYYNSSDPGTIDTPEWHKLLFTLENVTGDTTFVADYDVLVQRTTDYKVAMRPDVAVRAQHVHDSIAWGSVTYVWRMNAPQSRVEWLSPEPARYRGWYSKWYPQWDWDFETPTRSYPPGAETYIAFGEHPFTSGADMYVGTEYFNIWGSISEDTFGNTFANFTRNVSGNLTVIQNDVEVYHTEIWDRFWESISFSGTPVFTVIIEGSSDLNLSTSTYTELRFIANRMQDYQPPRVTMRPTGSSLLGTVSPGEVLVNVTVSDEGLVSSVGLEYSLDDGATWTNTVEVVTFDDTYQFSLNILSGMHAYVSLRVNATDSVGNSISQTAIRGFYTHTPTTIDNYDGLWHTQDFIINLTANDDLIGVAETYYKINDGPTKSVSIDGYPLLTIESANNALEYWSVNNVGNEELPHKILTGIKLDKTTPTGSITINNGEAYTTPTSVTLTLTATDDTSGVYQVRYSNDGVWDTEPWELPSQNKSWTLTSDDGTKTVYYQIKDNAGLVSIMYSDLIILDTAPPTGSITINEQATYTTTTTVTLTLSTTDATSGIAEMRFSNDNTTYTDWGSYASLQSWNLQDGDGAKTVYVQFRDHAGLISTYSDTIILDTTPPTGSVTVAESATYTNSTSVTLTLSANDITSGVHQTRFSNDNITWTLWEAYSASKAWAFTAGDGTKTVYVQFIDNAGLISSCQDTITLDTTRPKANAGIDQTVAEDLRVTFNGSASWDENGITSYMWTFTDVTLQTLIGVTPTYNFITPSTYIITLTVEDAAGNTATDTVTITVLLDTDGDGIGNNADTDDDNDRVPDATDAFPLDSTESVDTDGDGVGNNADTDDDNDGVPDVDDAFPLDASESVDTDGDAVGNNADLDDDNDGMPDTWETENGLNPLDAADASLDPDGDGLTNLQEYQRDTNPNVSDAQAFPWWILGAIAGIAVIGIALGTFFLRRRKSVKS